MSEIKICDDLSYCRNQRAIEPLIAKSKFLLHPSRRMAWENLRHGVGKIFSSGFMIKRFFLVKQRLFFFYVAGVAGNPAAPAFCVCTSWGVADATRTAAAVNRKQGFAGR